MIRRLLVLTALLGVASCAPVLQKDLMREGAREFDPRHLIETPEVFKDKLYIFGGVIVETRLVEEGSLIEALYVPVDRYGYLEANAPYRGRFLARYPLNQGMLDPMIYKKGREITLAADFVELRPGKIDEREVLYPFFEIREIYLWDEYRGYPYYYDHRYAYPYPYYRPYWYDPWWRPYPGPYWPPP